jgi:carbonic anhydrase
MVFTRRTLLQMSLGAGISRAVAGPKTQALTADQIHRELVEGNRRFASGHSRHPHSSLSWAKRAGRLGQHPHAVVLCCSDSRVVPEILFDQGIGDLFTIRVAGNVANEDEVGSIEYGVEHLAVPLCVVLGHTSCGAVTAVVKCEELPIEISHLVSPIRTAHEKAKALYPGLKEQSMIQATVRLTVLDTVATLRKGPKVLDERIKTGSLRIEGGVYDLETGRVSWM